jgi:hypothetical protein
MMITVFWGVRPCSLIGTNISEKAAAAAIFRVEGRVGRKTCREGRTE